MARAIKLIMVACVALAMAACTDRSPQAVEVDRAPVGEEGAPQAGQQPDSQIGGPQGNRTTTQVGISDSGDLDSQEASFPVAFYEKQLMEAASITNTKNLSYKFTYINIERSGSLDFENGKAEVTIDKLPVGQLGKITLEISEGGTVKLRGEKSAVRLQAGNNNRVDISMTEVNGGPDGDDDDDQTDLVLDVTLDDRNDDDNNTIDDGDDLRNDDDDDDDNISDTDRIVREWDGKSFKGNSRWKIVPVEG